MKLSMALLGILILTFVLWLMGRMSDDLALWIMSVIVGSLMFLSQQAEKRETGDRN